MVWFALTAYNKDGIAFYSIIVRSIALKEPGQSARRHVSIIQKM